MSFVLVTQTAGNVDLLTAEGQSIEAQAQPGSALSVNLPASYFNGSVNNINNGVTIHELVATSVARASGRFRVTVEIDYNGTAGDQITWSIETQTGTGAITSTGSAAVGVGVLESTDAANGVAITAGGGSAHTVRTAAPQLGTGQTTSSWSWSGIVDNNGAPFTLGNNVLVSLVGGSNAHTISGMAASISLQELPLGS